MNTVSKAVLKMLADYKGDNVENYTSFEHVSGYSVVDTSGHGYLVIDSQTNGYSEAISIARKSNFSYILDGGIVALEEDVDATEFLNIMTAVQA